MNSFCEYFIPKTLLKYQSLGLNMGDAYLNRDNNKIYLVINLVATAKTLDIASHDYHHRLI